MTFEEYLTKRRVNVAAFATAEPQRFAEWQNWFGQMHPESFYMLVKMVLNDVRRNYWLAEVPKPVATSQETETASSTPARPAGRRAAIARPTAVTPETAQPENPAEIIAKPAEEIAETKPAENAQPGTEISEGTAAAKPGRPVFKPRGVIKKPIATPSVEINPETSEVEKAAETNSAEAPKPATENPDAAPAKPARPRAVIKRPAALSKPEESTEKTVGDPAEKPASGVSETPGNSLEKGLAGNTETPKPARPRPVFKRPTATASTGNSDSEAEKTLGETQQKSEVISAAEMPVENPVAKPGQEGASEAKAVAEEIHDNPEAAKAAEEVAAEAGHVPKPPRPRPVYKRPAPTPAPTENSADEPEKTLGEMPEKPEANVVEISPEKPAQNASEITGDSTEKTEESISKPPRPRPIFKRLAKPSGDNGNSL